MSIEKCKDFEKDGYGTWDDSSRPTTYANMHDFMKNQNNVTLALANGLWQPSTAYSVGAVIHSPSLPAGCKATCTTAGTTGSTEPGWTAYGTTVSDGTVTWKIETDVQSTIMNEVTDAINRKIVSGTGSGSGSIDLSAYAKKTDLSAYQTKLTFDTTPTANSTNPVTSGGIKSYVDSKVSSSGGSGSVDLSGYQTKLTFDTTPTANSNNPVTSGGIKAALDGKPSNTGAGASGTWGININGNASTATKATQDDYGHVIRTTYATKADLSNYYTKSQVDSAIAAGGKTVDLSNYYTKAQVDSAISNAISNIVDGDSKSY